ncbi:Crp/Fnr family transcriptional regulator [Clostridium butyricum]|uniref:Crp/Fnr family transcriptional regulator n=1 Tax=Clostridium butyricum TaxID=1492 RepID=UPI003D32CD62
MKYIKDKKEIQYILDKAKIDQYFDTPNLLFNIRKYSKGEFLKHPLDGDDAFQFIIDGNVNIYYIRENGTKYFLSQCEGFFTIGDMEFLEHIKSPIYAEALGDVISITISLTQYKNQLLNDNKFLNLVLKTLSQILSSVTTNIAINSTLQERLLNHMKYYCQNGILHGVEKSAFRLNCSNRQLQRVLNELMKKEIIKKCGKGKYKLINI